ncbi:site-specific integrase [Micromonospora sp. S4605]|nr:site-specific integrase [Micromonospora sp. S4605]
MAVDDLWYVSKKKKRGPNGERIPTAQHGVGMRWRVRWTDPKTSKQVTRRFERQKDAEDFDALMRADITRGTYRDPKAGRVTLADYARGWLAEQTSDVSTREAVEMRFRVHILPALGSRTLRELEEKPAIVRAWVRGLTNARDDRPLAASTARAVFANLSACLSAAVDDELISRNPCRVGSVKPPTMERRKAVPWSAERVEAVRSGLPDRYAAMVDCGAGIGLRQGEVIGLAVDDVDWLRRVVHVRRQVKRVGNRAVFAKPKEGKERDVPLSEAVSLRLAAHLKAFPAQPVTLPWMVPDGKPVTASLIFTGSTGKEINRNHFNAALWKPALVAAGVIPAPVVRRRYVDSREYGFHALRHRYASVMLAGGVDIRALAEYLGHSDPGFTLRTYTHLMPSGEDTARRAIDRAYADTPEVILSRVVPDLYPRGAHGA